MNPRIAWKLITIVPFVLAFALVGCGDGDSTTVAPEETVIEPPDTP